jgi:predicted RNA-binding Zn-ribbon protein involved in translation (DUF1610 family)
MNDEPVIVHVEHDGYEACGWTDDTEVMWECTRCGGAIVDREAHDRFHRTLYSSAR